MANESGIKYRFGLDGAGQLVDIGAPGVLRGQDYICLSCNRALRPVLGEVRKRHFRHRHDADCSPETYLHNLAKLTFYNAYRACLDTEEPYWFEYPVRRRCTYCEHGPCSVPGTVERTDLTRVFREVFLELRDGDFIPDILLQGESGHKLYIEVVVTHYAEEKKQRSGIRIIEVKIESEDDVEMLRSGVLSLSDERVHGYNLRTAPAEGDFKEMCQQEGIFFHLDVHGAARQAVMSYSVLPDLQAKGGYIEPVSNLSPELFLNRLRHVLGEGRGVRHCWLCVHHGMEGHISTCGHNQSISGYWPTGAVDCELFKRWSEHLVLDVLDWVLENLQKRMKAVELVVMEPTAPHPLDWTGKCEFCGKVTSDWYVFDRKTGKCKCNACGRGKGEGWAGVLGAVPEPP